MAGDSSGQATMSFGDAWVELEDIYVVTVNSLDHAVAHADGSHAFTITYGHYLVRYGASFGRTSTRIKVNRNPVQTLVVKLDAAQPSAGTWISFEF